jgi:hypothetical protein
MNYNTLFKRAQLLCLLALFVLSLLLPGSYSVRTTRAANPRVAYIYLNDPTITADAFNSILTGRGVDVDLFTDAQAAASGVTFSNDDVIILADDLGITGSFQSYNNIRDSNKPVVGIGLGGVVFLNRVNPPVVGSGAGFSLSGSAYDVHLADPYAPIWSSPSPVSQNNQAMSIYSAAVSVYPLSIPEPVQYSNRIGRLIGSPDQYSLFATEVDSNCYSYWGYRGLPAVMTPSGQNLFLNMTLGSPCAAGTYSVNSALAASPPTIEGVLNYGEWSLTPNRLEMDHGFLAVMNDGIRLYLVLDVLESTVNTSGVNNQNDFWVTFDRNAIGQIDPGVDLNYAMGAATHNMRFQHYLAPAQWDFLSTSTKSSLGPGFDCYTPDTTKILNIYTQTFDCSAHQLWEVAIDLNEIGAQPGQTIHMGLRTYSPGPHFADELPNALDVDFSNLITVHLAGLPVPTHDPNADIAFGALPVEITQVVQDANHTVPLVADKTTAGRVSVIATNTNTPQPVVYYLYGQRGGADLPGSPLVQSISAPLAVNRGNLKDTANFLLPPTWTTPGDATFHAEASDYNGHSISTSASPLWLTFNPKKVPLYWVIQENNGTANMLNLPSQTTLDSYKSYVRTVFPVPDVTFVQKPWTAVGALNGMSLDNNVALVVKYYNTISAAYWTAIMQNKQPPYDLPDIVFGVGSFGGGLADATWFKNGGGHAGVGGGATSAEGVIAHEMNHSLDRSSNGTWGRHVGACGATGPDPNWPGGNNPANPAIGDYGFDTRLPWQNSGSSQTVVGTTWPDIMSYCTSGLLPTKWISPYRFKAWFGSASFPVAPAALPENSIYIHGVLDAGGAGSLEPVFLAPGMPTTPSPVGAYTILMTGPGISVSHSFDVAFEDMEGNPLTKVEFDAILPDPGNVTDIQLFHGPQLLAAISKAASPPSATFVAPGSGSLSGITNVSWSLTLGTVAPAGLLQTLEFSADNGNTWIPVGFNIPGTIGSYALDTDLLPMTTGLGRLRLLISDGLNNVIVDSPETFSVGNHPPAADILAPTDQGFIPAGANIILKGDASDVDEKTALPDNRFLWQMDGDTTLGIGRTVQVVLPNGQHTLTLSVLDSQGAIGTETITVFVNQYRIMLPILRK